MVELHFHLAPICRLPQAVQSPAGSLYLVSHHIHKMVPLCPKLKTMPSLPSECIRVLDPTLSKADLCQHIWFSAMCKGCSRNYPGGAFFFQTPPPPGHTWSQSAPPPRPSGHVSASINQPHYGSNTPWLPGQVTPHPLDMSTNTLPHRTKKSASPPG